MCQVFSDAQRAQDVGRLQRLAGAGRARADCVVLHGHQQALSLHKGKGHVDVAVVALLLISVQLHMGHTRADAVKNLMIEPLSVLGIVNHFPLGDLAGLAHTHHQRRRQSPRSEPSFLSATIDERSQAYSGLPPQEKRTHSLGPVHLMPTDAHEVNIHLVYVDIDLAHCLSGISMEEYLVFPTELAYFLNILPHSDLIVHQNNTDTKHFLLRLQNSLLQQLHIQNTVLLHRQIRHLKALKLQMPACIEDAFMLNLCRDDMLALIAVEFGQAFQHHIVGLSCAGCEDNLLRIRLDQSGYLFTS